MNKKSREWKHPVGHGPSLESLVWLLLGLIAMTAIGMAIASMVGLVG